MNAHYGCPAILGDAMGCGMFCVFKRLIKDEDGATAIEYGLIAALIATALISGFGMFSNALSNQFQMLANMINV